MATIFFGDYMIDGAKYDKFSKIRQLTRAEFDAIVDKDPDTMYVITDEENSGSGTVGDMTKAIYDPNNIASDIFGYGYSKDEIDNLLSSGVKIQTGSYVGTGTYGAGNPCSLTFNFVPKILFICVSGSLYDCWYSSSSQVSSAVMTAPVILLNTGASVIYGGRYTIQNSTAGADIGRFQFTGNTVSWFVQNYASADLQMNINGTTYFYLVIG